MNPFDLVKALLSNIPEDRWVVSVNGVRTGPVTKTNTKLQDGHVNLDFGYKDGDKEHSLTGVIPLLNAGRPGGNDQFTFDGQDVEHDDFVLSSRFVFPKGPSLVVEFKFSRGSEAFRIRFDGRMFG